MQTPSRLSAGIRREELLSGGHGLMIWGYLPVINTLAKGLHIRLGHRYNQSWLGTGKHAFVADAVVIDVPLGVLKAKRIEFEPRLPEWKEEAIAELGVGTENKISLHFANVFWPNVEFLGVVAPTSYGCSYFLNIHKATGRSVLVYMPAGRLAHDIGKMSDAAAANFAFLQLKKVFPDASEPFCQLIFCFSPCAHLVSHWKTDVNSLGSYNMFFAGEATKATSASYPGTVHGAFSTGKMASEECRMRGELDILNSFTETETQVPIQISQL
ncbi:hypothetical protein MKX03_015828 [Papaver bracteatum]|nr:hypothetical protein MKX03_015828 [Papaver bracteatum]